MLAVTFLMVAVTSTVFAATFADGGVKISAENGNGRIHVTGAQGDVDKYVRDIQFCPDQVKYQKDFVCGLNWPIPVERVSPTEAVFQLDMNAVANGQRAFNFKNDGHWSQVSTSKLGGNLVVEMSDPNGDSEDGRGGCHYTYVGDLPAGSYTPYNETACGGAARVVRTVAKPAPAPTAPRAEMVQTVVRSSDAQIVQSKQVAKVSVKIKGNNNTVITKIRQQKNINQQKGATVKIKGSNNKVKACTVNINITNQLMGGHAVAPNNCAGCHNNDVWPHLSQTYGTFKNCTTSTVKK